MCLHCLQLWYNLSDPGLEDAVHDRLSFQRFLGLDLLHQRVPDEATVLHFRSLLESHGLAERIFAKINESLAAKGPSAQRRHYRGRDDFSCAEQHQEPGRQARSRDELEAKERGLALRDKGAHRRGCRTWPGANSEDDHRQCA